MSGPWFLRQGPDVLGLLREQARVTAEAVSAFERWSKTGDAAEAQRVRDGEHTADGARRAVLDALRRTLITPLDQEDLYALSERLDQVINEAKNVVREADALAWEPDPFAAEMAEHVREAADLILAAFVALPDDPGAAGRNADAATKRARALQKAYRRALAAIPMDGDLRTSITMLHLYSRYDQIADAIARVSHRTWYAVLKEQ